MNLNWLRKFPAPPDRWEDDLTPSECAKRELEQAFPGRDFMLTCSPALGDTFAMDRMGATVALTGGETGILYGAYRLIRAAAAGETLPSHLESAPKYALRMIECWDNMDGTVERGYAGRSLFFEGGRFAYDPARVRHVARMMASVGLNVLCINNVNVREPAQSLMDGLLPDLSALADLFRPFGVRLMISVDFSVPLHSGAGTADPLSPEVQRWWAEAADRIYAEVPDLAGFLVKADSEGQPGPHAYGRTHAEGANTLAAALKPHGGTVVWRCFVYNCRQDWRDTSVDRPKAAFETYRPLDGQFAENVILQVKNGPFDFQVREPVSPLLLGMERTNLALEVQLAQEYTGHQIDLYTMAPLFGEILADVPAGRLTAMAAVSNMGRDENYFGHPLAAANLFAFGLLSWDPEGFDPAGAVESWIRLTYDLSEADAAALKGWMLRSREIYEKYTATLGLCWMITPGLHYGPNPMGYEFDLWGTYHRADRQAVGIDRTAAGTGYLLQYPPSLQRRYENAEKCPDNLKLFFHRLAYDYVMPDGRTLIQRIYDDHFEGAAEAKELAAFLKALPFPNPDKAVIAERADRQVENAENWRDVVNTFFYRYAGVPDGQGRRIYP